MGQITILNGTNVPINSCISTAGVNYSWCNKLSPRTFYKHDGAAGVYTLETNYWMGESSEFTDSALEIFTMFAGVILTVIGLIALPFSGVASGALLYFGFASTGVGTVVTAISIAARAFFNEPTHWTNIHAIHNRYFIAEGNMEFEQIPNSDDSVRVNITEITPLTLREITHEEFDQFVQEHNYVEKGSILLSIEGGDSKLLKSRGFLDSPLNIVPHKGGDACWEIENDQTKHGSPIQLWPRQGEKQVVWKIIAAEEGDDNKDFYLYNPELDCWMGNNSDYEIESRMVTKGSMARSRFYIVYIHKNTHVFIPKKAPSLMVICEKGNLGKSTKLVLDSIEQPDPFRGYWDLKKV